MPHGSWFPGDPWTIETLYREQPEQLQKKRRRDVFNREIADDDPTSTTRPWGRYKRKVYVGVDCGKRADPSAIAVLIPFEPFERRADGRDVYEVPFIRRIPLDTPYPDVARAIARLDDYLRRRGDIDWIYYCVDSGGVGESVVDMVKELLPNIELYKAYLTGGYHVNQKWETREISLPKAQMVSTMIMLFESERIEVSGEAKEYRAEIEALQDELYNYELRTTESKHDLYGAFTVGKHDDLATSLGLGAWLGEFFEGRGEVALW